MKGKIDLRNNISQYICITAILLTVIVVAIVRYPNTEVNYLNSDATWHTLLTIEAYNETPISEHYFLPIVSLGEQRDKGISWGSTISDEKGNYYYTSFSPMGYVLPYLFIKIFSLPISESSLYIFNTLLLLISCVVIYLLLSEIFSDRKQYLIMYAVFVAYILSPEIMHGMGLVYWHQSLMQVFLPLQILFYSKFIKNEKKKYGYLTLLMCLINPYTEWTGYVANGGLFIAELIRNRKQKGIKKISKALSLGICTVLSFVIFCGHYLLVTDMSDFFNALKNRFLARNATTNTQWSLLFTGYWSSFAALITLVCILCIVCIYKKQSFRFMKSANAELKLILFVSIFPVIENFIMKQHAVSYTYDRMKLALPLVILLYYVAVEAIDTSKINMQLITMLLVLVGVLPSCYSYMRGGTYFWNIDYEEGNEELCEYINENFDNSVVGFNSSVRGYLNMTLMRGCFEWTQSICQLMAAGDTQGTEARYFILLSHDDVDGKDTGNHYKLSAQIYDTVSGQVQMIFNNGNAISVSDWTNFAKLYESTPLYASEFTDDNWTSGIFNADNKVILMKMDGDLLLALENASNIKCNDDIYVIKSIDYDSNWIKIYTDKDASELAYPSELYIE